MLATSQVATGRSDGLLAENLVPEPTSFVSEADFRCAVEQLVADEEIRVVMDSVLGQYADRVAERVAPLTNDLESVRGDIRFVLGDLRTRGPVSGLTESAHDLWRAREDTLARLDQELYRSMKAIVGSGLASQLEQWWRCNEARRQSSSGSDQFFARVDPRAVVQSVQLADGSPVVPDCWPCVVGQAAAGLPSVSEALVEGYVTARDRFREAARQAMLQRAAILDLEWELVAVAKAGDRERIQAIHARRAELEARRGLMLLEPALDFERAERRLREALVSSLDAGAAQEYESQYRAMAFGVLWQDPLSVTPFLLRARSSMDLPEGLLDRLATIDAGHRAEEERRSRELIEAQREHWPFWMAQRVDERSLRLGLLAQRAVRLRERREIHSVTRDRIVAAFEEFDLDPPTLPAEPEGSLEPLLAGIAPFHLGGIPYKELEETFLSEHEKQQPRRSRRRPVGGRGG